MSALDLLVADLDGPARGPQNQATVDAVAAALTPHLGRPGLLTSAQREGDPAGHRPHILHVAPDGAWSLLGLVWLPGQTTVIHDHLTWCVVGVHEGMEDESRFRVCDDELEVTGRLVSGPGTVAGLLPPGDIHQVTNSGTGLTISLHVYGLDLRIDGSSIRRRYDLPVRMPAAA
jgi:3-mercaptopropionate dioxygenase